MAIDKKTKPPRRTSKCCAAKGKRSIASVCVPFADVLGLWNLKVLDARRAGENAAKAYAESPTTETEAALKRSKEILRRYLAAQAKAKADYDACIAQYGQA